MSAPSRSARASWTLFAAFGLTLLLALVLQGFSDQQLGAPGTRVPTGGTGAPVGGSLLAVDENGPTSRRMPDRTVALTFDDGPDPTWTPRVLDALREAGVPATFFPIGSRAAAHGDLLRRIEREGSELGLHTWTHADLAASPSWRQRLELSLDAQAFAGATGRVPRWVRPPYSSTPAAVTGEEAPVLDDLVRRGHLVALADRDGQDWRRPGVDAVVAGSLPPGDEGAVVLLHDGGGDRSQTVAAIPRIVEELRGRGYRFTTLSGGLGLPADQAQATASPLRRAQGLALLAAVATARAVSALVAALLVPLGVLAVLRTLVLVVLARRHVGVAAARAADGPDWLPPVSVVVPAYQEAVGIAAAVRSLVRTDHPEVEVVVVDDGSTDGTADIVRALGLPGVRVVRQDNAGKPAALNTGLAATTHDIVVMVDGDTVFEPDTITRLVQPLRDPSVGAVSGNTKVGNRTRVLGRWQHLEYVVGFNLDRRMYDLLHCMPTIPGAIGAFRRSVLEQVGGVSGDTLAEDTDLTMAVVRTGSHVVYEERARAWTEAPSSLSALWRQRYRWCYGTLQAVWKHRDAVRERGAAGRLGRVGLPYLLAFQVALPLLAPLVDVFAVYGLLFLDARRVALAWLAFLVLQAGAAAYALRLDREPLGPLWTLPLQQLVYRQLMYLVVVQSVVAALAGVRLRWHVLQRTGDVVVRA